MTQNDSEWAIPKAEAPLDAAQTGIARMSQEPGIVRMTNEPISMRCGQDSNTFFIPVTLWPLSMDAMRIFDTARLVKSISKPGQITIMVPVENDNVEITLQMVVEHTNGLMQHEWQTDTDQTAEIIERMHGIGDAPVGIIIVVGDDLKEYRKAEAQAAANRVLDAVGNLRMTRRN